MNNQKNTFCWIDIPVNDLDRAISFYSAVLDEPVQKINEHGFEFGLLPHTENNVSGCLVVMENRLPSNQGPLVYLNVEGRLKEAVVVVEEMGGTVLKPVESIGPYGNRAVILDSEGNGVALYSKEV
ncbi:VOC family protein [Legionella impletisoli]|uniref:Glyoxalase n=1 Tax=Legionella impletisoli TaxID=343510 RepID=A0A917NBV9_9GAMM|nr:VOC family protein [Legionella impletisoli]GGI81912.1 glyoxalase [Legionella impletisoli]